MATILFANKSMVTGIKHLSAGFGLLLVLALLPAHVRGADVNKLQQIEKQVSEQKRKQAELDRNAREVNENLKGLRKKLIAATEALEEKTDQDSRLEDKLDALSDEIDAKQKSFADRKEKLRAFTAALIEMARQPVASFFLRDGLTTDYVRRSILVRSLMPHLKDDVLDMARDLMALNRMKGELNTQRDLVASARQNLQEQRKGLDQLIRTRQGHLQRTEEEKTAISQRLAMLSTEAKDLRQLLQKITPRTKPQALPPAEGKGLKWPVSGTMTRRFGDKDADGVTSQGISFSALAGSAVVAPAAGKVVFTGPFRGYGQIVILQHEGGYHSFLSGFGRIDADMGQEVERGEPIGVLPSGESRRSELYFEWRRNSEPVDPASGIALLKNH